MNLERIKEKLLDTYHWIDRHTGSSLSVLRTAVVRFNRERGAEAAAGIAYYALFSLFPLLIFLISASGLILIYFNLTVDIQQFITRAIPTQSVREFVRENLGAVLENRNTGTLIGLGTLAVTASGAFFSLSRNINRAWPSAKLRGLLEGRLVAVVMIFFLALVLILAAFATTIANLLPTLNIIVPIRGGVPIYETFIWRFLTELVPIIISFLVFFVLYYWVPSTKVKWLEAFWGALVAAIGWNLATFIFSFLLSNEFIRYRALYGALGTILALLTWIYQSGMILIFGAHISAAVAIVHRPDEVSDTAQDEEA